MSVTACHPNYNYWIKRYKLVRAIIANDAQCYIRTIDPNDICRSTQYKQDAILTNFTRLTKDGLTGLVFRKTSNIVLPPELDYMDDDATGDGLGLDQLANRIIGEVLQTGRYGLLVDYPKATPSMTGMDKEESGMLCRIKPYNAESITNFRCQHIGSKYMLVMVKLRELVEELEEDGFTWCQKYQYRVLYLDFAGRYAQTVYNEQDEVIEGPLYPTDYNGNTWSEIPFQFIGSENNDAEFDQIPLYDLAVLNLGHYRNSADEEESGFVCGQPYPVICVGESSPEQFKDANPNGIQFGSRSGLTVGNGGSASLLQANANQLISNMMANKLIQAAALGARLITPAGGRETAEAARIRYGSQNSSLYVITNNISMALEKVLQWACLYQGGNPELVEFELNDQFYEDSADPNLIMAQIQLLDRGVLAKNDVRDYARRTGFVNDTRTNEMIDSEAEIADPLVGNNGS